MDQTQFLESQEILQAPPIPEPPPHQLKPETPSSPTPNRHKKALIAALIILAVSLLLAVIATILKPSRSSPTNQPPEFNLKSNQDQSAFTQRFRELQNQLNEYDPTDIELAPPPVNYQIFSRSH